MKVIGINGKEYAWNLTSYSVDANDKRKRSKFHVRARKLLKTIYHSYRILEEVKLPGSTESHRKGVLYLDFYIPLIKTCIEFHGEQHYKFIGHYHGNRFNFIKAKQRDMSKKEWCELNNITHLELKFDQTDEQWKEIIEN